MFFKKLWISSLGFMKKIKLKDFKNFDESIFISRKKTFYTLAGIISVTLTLVFYALIIQNNNFYNNHTDDVIQYYTIMYDFITKLKTFSFSLYNMNNYFGASIFSDAYYVPMDIFTLITWIISYFVPIEFAYSITEFFKIFSGVMVFAYFLHLCKMKNKTIFYMSILYFASGGYVSFMAFPVYLSLVFYLPLALVIIHFYLKGKKYILPLYILAIVFYNFYIAYTVIIYMGFMFLILSLKASDFSFKKFVKDGISFVILTLVGVLMASIILLPSAMYILEDTFRTPKEYPLWAFKFEQYIRIVAKIFAPTTPTSYYGFQNSYVLEHISLYVTVVGFMYMIYVFFMRDKTSIIYQIVILLGILFMCFPVVSMIFSGSPDVPYTRWINFLPLIQILVIAHVFEEYEWNINFRKLIIPSILVLALLGYLVYYYDVVISSDKKLSSEAKLIYDRYLLMFAMGVVISFMTLGFWKRWTVKYILVIEVIISIVYMFSASFNVSNKIERFNLIRAADKYIYKVVDEETDDFYRVFSDPDIGIKEYRNYNRMNTFYSNLSIFHSFYDEETNGFTELLFSTKENQSKKLLDRNSLYLNHFLGYKYVVVESDTDKFLNERYFKLIDDDGVYATYEINGAEPFSVYESFITTKNFDAYNTMTQQKMLLSHVVTDEQTNLNSYQTDYDLTSSFKRYSDYNEIIFDKATYYEYDIDITQTSGIMYYTFTNSLYFGKVYTVDEEGNKTKCFPNYCYFDKNPDKILIYRTSKMKSKSSMPSLKIYIDDFTSYDKYLNSSPISENKKMIIYGNKIGLSYTRINNENEQMILIPIPYSEEWAIIDKKYKTISVSGGFLGILIPPGESEIDISLKFTPKGLIKGAKLSLLGVAVYTLGLGSSSYLSKKKNSRKEEINDEEDYNYSSLL